MYRRVISATLFAGLLISCDGGSDPIEPMEENLELSEPVVTDPATDDEHRVTVPAEEIGED